MKCQVFFKDKPIRRLHPLPKGDRGFSGGEVKYRINETLQRGEDTILASGGGVLVY